jgi:pyruvate ferredoxin oxidoreductase alpha subunit
VEGVGELSAAAAKPVQRLVPKTRIWTGTRAIAEAVKIADVDVIAAYPIRPYTGVMNELARMISEGEFSAEIIVADSEHSQFEIAKHASAVGARTFVGSSGVGLLYAAEAITVTALAQLPVVALAGCRALDDPGNFGMEWNDTLVFRDFGWLVSWARDAQEALDMTLVAYRVSEDRRVLLPHFVAVDGATITHIASPVAPPDERIDGFLPPYKPPYPLDPDYGPVTKAQHIAPSLIGTEQRKVVDVSAKRSREVIEEAWRDFGRRTERSYPPFVEATYMDDAELAIVTMGAYTKDAVYVAGKLRGRGERVGVVRLRYWRPYPARELRELLEDVRGIAVLDFSYSFGSPDSGGAFYNELRAALYEASIRPLILDFLFAGGREPNVTHFEKAVEVTRRAVERGRPERLVYWPTLRGEDI